MNRYIIVLLLLIACDRTIKLKESGVISPKKVLSQTIDSLPVFMEGHTFEKVDGTMFSFENVKGKVLLLDFWHTRCKPCIREHPSVVALNQKINNPDFQIITISADREKKRWKNFITKNNWRGINIYTGSVYNDSVYNDNVLGRMIYKVVKYNKKELYTASFPSYFLIDKQLKITKVDSINDPSIESKIHKLIKSE